MRDRIQILEYWYDRIGTKTYPNKLDKDIRQSIKKLRQFPRMGRKYENKNIRFIVKDNYQIFYKFSENEVRILHIWDSRRNPDDLNFDE